MLQYIHICYRSAHAVVGWLSPQYNSTKFKWVFSTTLFSINSRCHSTYISVTDRPMQLLVGSAHNITRLSLDWSSVHYYFLSTFGVTVHNISVTDRAMQLLVGSAHNITRLSLEGSSVQHVVNGKIGDIDYDVRRGRLFWINMEESKVLPQINEFCKNRQLRTS